MTDALLIRDGFVYTADDADRILTRGSVLAVDGVITAVGEPSAVDEAVRALDPDTASALRVIDAGGAMVLPGFVNPHWHDMSALRATSHRARGCHDRDDEPGFLARGGNMPLISSLFDRFGGLVDELTPGEAEAIARYAIWSQLRGGVTTLGDVGSLNRPDALLAAVRALGIRGSLSTWAGDVVCRAGESRPHRTRDADEVLAAAEEVLRTCAADPSGRVRARPSAVYVTNVSDELGAGLAELAERFGTGFATHLGAQRHESDFVTSYFGLSPVRRFERFGLLSPRFMAVHCAFVDDADRPLLTDNGVHLNHSPAKYGLSGEATLSETRLLSQAIRAGRDVSLSTDGATFPLGGMVENMRAACQTHNEMYADHTVVPPTRALAMATRIAARGLQWDDQVGSLAVGKRADLVLVPVHDWRYLLNPRPLEAFLMLGGSTDVDTVIVDGQVVLDHGRSTRADERELEADYLRAVASFSARLRRVDAPQPRREGRDGTEIVGLQLALVGPGGPAVIEDDLAVDDHGVHVSRPAEHQEGLERAGIEQVTPVVHRDEHQVGSLADGQAADLVVPLQAPGGDPGRHRQGAGRRHHRVVRVHLVVRLARRPHVLDHAAERERRAVGGQRHVAPGPDGLREQPGLAQGRLPGQAVLRGGVVEVYAVVRQQRAVRVVDEGAVHGHEAGREQAEALEAAYRAQAEVARDEVALVPLRAEVGGEAGAEPLGQLGQPGAEFVGDVRDVHGGRARPYAPGRVGGARPQYLLGGGEHLVGVAGAVRSGLAGPTHDVPGPGAQRTSNAEGPHRGEQRVGPVEGADVAEGRDAPAQLTPDRVARYRLGLAGRQLVHEPAEAIEERRDEGHVAAPGQEAGFVVAVVAAARPMGRGTQRGHVVPVRVHEPRQDHRPAGVDDAQRRGRVGVERPHRLVHRARFADGGDDTVHREHRAPGEDAVGVVGGVDEAVADEQRVSHVSLAGSRWDGKTRACDQSSSGPCSDRGLTECCVPASTSSGTSAPGANTSTSTGTPQARRTDSVTASRTASATRCPASTWMWSRSRSARARQNSTPNSMGSVKMTVSNWAWLTRSPATG